MRSRELGNFVDFRGLIYDKESFFKSLDAHVSLSVGPDQGMALLESAVTGTPSFGLQLTKRYDGTQDVIPSHFDERELAGIILERTETQEAIQELGTKQRQWVLEHRSIESMARSYEAIYLRHLSHRGNSQAGSIRHDRV